MTPETYEMHRILYIFMVLEVGGRGRLGSESYEMHRTNIILMSWEVEGRGASGLRES